VNCGDSAHVISRWLYLKRANRPGDVLEVLLSHVLENNRELVPYVVANGAGHYDAAWRSDGLQASGGIDAVPVDVLSRYNDVAQVDANPEGHVLMGRHRLVTLRGTLLDLQCAAGRLYDAGEFGQEAITRILDESSVSTRN